jgi:hypothetical protein
MSAVVPPVITRMQTIITTWESQNDSRAIFLSCYRMMTNNMLTAIHRNEFADPIWVDRLLNIFADYYFVALDRYEHSPASSPAVWKLAFDASLDARVTPLQKLLLGVNAHINYDLVLTLVDLLEPEWAQISEDRRKIRYADHCLVNEIIGRTIDAVQDDVLEKAMPVMDVFDKLLGPLDEYLISRVISRWRENVWRHTVRMLECTDQAEHQRLLRTVEEESMRTGGFICGPRGPRRALAYT